MAKILVVKYPGSSGVDEVLRALALFGGECQVVSHRDESVPDAQVMILPGGYSFGDYLRPGALAKGAPISGAIRRFARDGKRIVGIGNGFQILCEMELLPGILLENESLSFVNRETFLVVENRTHPFVSAVPEGSILRLPVASYYGRYWADKRTLQDLEENSQIVLRYSDAYGDPDYDHGFNGSAGAIAAVLNRQKNVLGVMPRPDRAVEEVFGRTDGVEMFKGLLAV